MSDELRKHGETIPSEMIHEISIRYHKIARAINLAFWDPTSDRSHSFYVGSYGRNTAIDASDVDILVELPEEYMAHYDVLKGNVQSRLLQTVKNVILESYPTSEVKADGQIVKIIFSYGPRFEIVPACKNSDGLGYKYPDSNNGGSWEYTYPKLDQLLMDRKNRESNGLLHDTCRHIRKIHMERFSNEDLHGILIDSFVYRAIDDWKWEDGETVAPHDYLQALLDRFNNISENYLSWTYTSRDYILKKGVLFIRTPGGHEYVPVVPGYSCLGRVLEYMLKESVS